MVAVGGVAALGMAAVGWQGYQGLPEGARAPGVQEHVLLGLAAVLVLVLAHAWVAFYLLGAGRVLEEAAAGCPAALGRPFLSLRRGTLVPLLLVVSAGLATFVLGSAVHAGLAPAGLHGALLWLTLLCQGWAGWAEWRAVTEVARAARAFAA